MLFLDDVACFYDINTIIKNDLQCGRLQCKVTYITVPSNADGILFYLIT